jgi:type II secretory pathway component PulF
MSGESFAYVALDAAGRKVRGELETESTAAAHQALGRRGLVALRLSRIGEGGIAGPIGVRRRFGRRALADFLFDIGALTEAGVDFRSALGVLAGREQRQTAAGRLAHSLEGEIATGRGIEAAFRKVFGSEAASVAGLVAAGEAAGNLGGALRRGAESLEQDLDAAEGVLAAVSYPAFILLMTLASLIVILMFVVPQLAPLAQEAQTPPPLPLAVMFSLSEGLRTHIWLMLGTLAALVIGLATGWRVAFVRRILEGWLLDGPLGPIARALVFGGLAATLGGLLAARVPASQALQLAEGATSLVVARERLGRMAAQVREGARLSDALAACKGMPRPAVRLAVIGEEVGALGTMLERAGRLERARALRRIRGISQWLGPVLIVGLGLLIGSIMAGLLTSITALADTATGS